MLSNASSLLIAPFRCRPLIGEESCLLYGAITFKKGVKVKVRDTDLFSPFHNMRLTIECAYSRFIEYTHQYIYIYIYTCI